MSASPVLTGDRPTPRWPARVQRRTPQRAKSRPALAHRALTVLAPDLPAVRPAPWQRRRSPTEIKALAWAALAGYAAVGWSLRHLLHFAVGDALARTANARYLLFARDPHFGALGFVWMPIPTVSQLPVVAALEPFGWAADAGWVATALWGAGTVLVLGRLARDLGLRRPLGLLLVIGYAANPVVAYYAANGMSEGPLFFFLALTFLGLLRYLREGDTAALITTGLGLAGCALDRYEAIPLVGLVGGVLLVADLRRRGRRSALLATTLAVLPAGAGVLVWFLYMKVVKGSFRAFLTDSAGGFTATGATATTTTTVTPVPTVPAPYTLYRDVAGGMDWLHYSTHWCLAFAPALVLLPLLLLPPLRRSFGGAALLLVACWLPAVTAYLLRFGGSAGDPRYFTSVIVTTTVGVIFLASRVVHRRLAVLVVPVLAGTLVVGWVTGTHAQYDHASTVQEQEWRVFDVLRGSVDTRDSRGIVVTTALARALDRRLRPGDRVLLDVRFTFDFVLFSRKPGQMIINNDRDYEAVRADPYLPGRRIDYLVFPGPGARGSGVDYAEHVFRAAPTQWQLLGDPASPIRVYHRRWS